MSKHIKDTSAKIKGLKVEIENARSYKSELEKTRNSILKQIQEQNQIIGRATSQLNALTSGDLKVSEHAILNYIRTVLGLNTDDIVQSIATNKTLIEQYKALGGGKFVIDGIRYTIKDNVVTSVRMDKDG